MLVGDGTATSTNWAAILPALGVLLPVSFAVAVATLPATVAAVLIAAVFCGTVALIRRTLHDNAFSVRTVPTLHDKGLARRILLQSVDWGEVLTVPKPGGGSLSMVHSASPKSTHLIVLSHGKGAALTTQKEGADGVFNSQEVAKAFVGLGADLLVYDFSGYGASEGERGEAQWLADCDTAFRYARDVLRWPADKIVAAGQSVGTGLVIQHVARCPRGYAGVILFHPYRSILATKSVCVARFLLRPLDVLKSEDYIDDVAGPALIVHAQQDLTVPHSHGAFLARRLRARGQLHKFVSLQVARPQDAHARLFEVSPGKEQARAAIADFLEHLRATPGAQSQ